MPHLSRALIVSAIGALLIPLLSSCNILIYGDSLTSQAHAYNAIHSPSNHTVIPIDKPGTAPCDFLSRMPSDRARYHPMTVILAFNGNTSPCITAAHDPTAGYAQAYTAIRNIFPTEKIVIISPIAIDPRYTYPPVYLGSSTLVFLDRYYAPLIHATVSYAADDVLTPGHKFVWDRPPLLTCWLCAPVRVRTPDGVHLTPTGAGLYGWALTRRF